MAKWLVTMPICGRCTVEVEADTEEEAVAAGLSAGWGWSDLSEVETLPDVETGNVWHGPVGKAYAKEI